MPLIRVDAEALRDSILFIAGRLDETSYGPPELLFVRHDGMVMTPDSSAKAWRRSIYLQQRRMTVLTMLDLFDYPQMGPNCSKRASTAVAPQALFLLNNTMIRALADSLAQRVRKEAGDGLAQQIDRVYLACPEPPPDRGGEEHPFRRVGKGVRRHVEPAGRARAAHGQTMSHDYQFDCFYLYRLR